MRKKDDGNGLPNNKLIITLIIGGVIILGAYKAAQAIDTKYLQDKTNCTFTGEAYKVEGPCSKITIDVQQMTEMTMQFKKHQLELTHSLELRKAELTAMTEIAKAIQKEDYDELSKELLTSIEQTQILRENKIRTSMEVMDRMMKTLQTNVKVTTTGGEQRWKE